MTEKIVNCYRLPGLSKPVAVTSDMTVGQALEVAEITVNEGETVKGDGSPVALTANVNGFDTISVAGNIKGAH